MSTCKGLILLGTLVLCSALYAQDATLPAKEFRKQMTNLKRQTEQANQLCNHTQVAKAITLSDSLFAIRRDSGLYIDRKQEVDWLKLKGDYYYWLSLSETSSQGAAAIADSCYNACLKAYRQERIPMPDTSVIHNQLGQLYYAHRRYSESLIHLQSAAADNSPWTTKSERSTALKGIAMCYAQMERYDEALTTEEKIAEDSLSYTSSLRIKAKIYALAHEHGQEAGQPAPLYRRYIEHLREEADSVFRHHSSEERERWWVGIRPFITDCWRIEDEDPGLLYDVALLSKGILLQLDRDLTHASDTDRTRALHITWQDVQRNLSSHQYAIEWMEYERGGTQRLGAVLLKSEGTPRFIAISSLDSIKNIRLDNGKTVNDAILSSYDRDKDFLYTNEEVQFIIWDKIRAEIGSHDAQPEIYFAPDGLLHLMAIEYMYPSASAFQPSRLSSTRILAYGHGASLKTREPALIIGGIDYDATTDNNTDEDSGDKLALPFLSEKTHHIQSLPFTRRECDSISKIRNIQRDFTLLADSASEQAFRKHCSQYHMIHFSTHGFFNGKVENGNSDFPLPQTVDAALSQSGLIMAGINPHLNGTPYKASNDGILSSRELSGLHMDSVQLCVVCACQGALGNVTHDGVFGVQRGLKSAGVKAMIVSLWKVSDQASSMLMTNLYRYLAKGYPLSMAFDAARHDLQYYSPSGAGEEDFDMWDDELFPFATPYFTNAFVLIDDFF